MNLRAWVLVAACLFLGCDEGDDPAPEPDDTATPSVEAERTAAEAAREKRSAARARLLREKGLDPPAAQAARERLVRIGIVAGGVSDDAVLTAMRRVPRHLFVPEAQRRHAYVNRPLPIGWDQTISQPYIVASMTEELRLAVTHRVLEIGTGSGYQAAVLAEITPHVYSIEIKAPLARRAAQTLKALGYDEVETRQGDGYHGWKERGPFDAIIVTAAAPHVPPPLVRQLKPGGRLVIPVGRPLATQALKLVTKDEQGRVRSRDLYPVRFVPLTGSLGEAED